VAEAIGEAVARWQAIRPAGYGPFSAEQARASNRLIGLHTSYASYYTLNLDRHLQFLSDRGFFSAEQAEAVRETVRRHAPVLDIGPGCLVHKDLALWNMLGTPQKIVAFIDWDDAVSGDPMDDLSLLACFYDAPVVASALAGYAHVRPLPENHLLRFWLHLAAQHAGQSRDPRGRWLFRPQRQLFLNRRRTVRRRLGNVHPRPHRRCSARPERRLRPLHLAFLNPKPLNPEPYEYNRHQKSARLRFSTSALGSRSARP
jgi:Ser/Thr protein kinase RdoA (MazF antagonist)